MSGTDRLGAHAALWYADARYRSAWLVLPQAAIALVAGLALLLLKPTADWGKPADSKDSEKIYLDLLDKAGKDGDKAAFEKLKAAADAGDISARSFMGALHNPEWAGIYVKNPRQARCRHRPELLSEARRSRLSGRPAGHDRSPAQPRARPVRSQARLSLRARLSGEPGRDPEQLSELLVDALLDRRLLRRRG
ncbi:hypothetical protein [Methylobacterium sp.]|uniref:hypothetical protein n=1 Tax=Methylobacterium sp. TaxID=409 RepID=UPI003B5B9701